MKFLHGFQFLAWATFGHATLSDVQLAIPAGILSMRSNASHPVHHALDKRSDLQIREECAANSSPDCGYCSNNGKWCISGSECCPTFCSSIGSFCCGAGQCLSTQYCCNNDGCIEPQDECCLYGGYCPSPFKCYLIVETGKQGCCTDSACTVYLDNGQTTTWNPSPTATSFTPVTSVPTTQQQATPTAGTAIIYQTYYTTITFYYYYSYYAYPSISTSDEPYYATITSTYTSITSMFSCSATDQADADYSFEIQTETVDLPGSIGASSTSTPVVFATASVPGATTSVTESGGSTSAATRSAVWLPWRGWLISGGFWVLLSQHC